MITNLEFLQNGNFFVGFFGISIVTFGRFIVLFHRKKVDFFENLPVENSKKFKKNPQVFKKVDFFAGFSQVFFRVDRV